MSLADICNFHHPLPEIYSSGQPRAEQFREIAGAGVQVVINLALPDSEGALADEGARVTALGMDYCHLPVRFDAPELERLHLFCNLMRALEGRRLWVHCVLNWRVSAFLYLYCRGIQGWEEKRARAVMLPGWEPDPVWQAFIRKGLGALS